MNQAEIMAIMVGGLNGVFSKCIVDCEEPKDREKLRGKGIEGIEKIWRGRCVREILVWMSRGLGRESNGASIYGCAQR